MNLTGDEKCNSSILIFFDPAFFVRRIFSSDRSEFLELFFEPISELVPFSSVTSSQNSTFWPLRSTESSHMNHVMSLIIKYIICIYNIYNQECKRDGTVPSRLFFFNLRPCPVPTGVPTGLAKKILLLSPLISRPANFPKYISLYV